MSNPGRVHVWQEGDFLAMRIQTREQSCELMMRKKVRRDGSVCLAGVKEFPADSLRAFLSSLADHVDRGEELAWQKWKAKGGPAFFARHPRMKVERLKIKTDLEARFQRILGRIMPIYEQP